MPDLQIIAHNIRSTENVGSLFRTCDSLGVAKLWLTGYTPDPTHPKVKKTALGAQDSVPYEHVINIDDLMARLKAEGYRIIGLELDERAVDLKEYRLKGERLALLLGSEVEGIAPYLRDQCDDLVFIPQRGVKESLNVSVAAGIAAYSLMLKS